MNHFTQMMIDQLNTITPGWNVRYLSSDKENAHYTESFFSGGRFRLFHDTQPVGPRFLTLRELQRLITITSQVCDIATR